MEMAHVGEVKLDVHPRAGAGAGAGAGGAGARGQLQRQQSTGGLDPVAWDELWDYVMVFPVKKDEDLNDFQKRYTVKKVVHALHKAGLITKLFLSGQQDEIFLKIRAPYERLLAEADRVNYLLQLDPEAAERIAAQPVPGVRKAIRLVDDVGMSRRSPFDHIYGKYDSAPHLQPLYRRYPPFGVFRRVDRLKLIMSILEAPRNDKYKGAGLDPKKLMAKKALLAFYALHDPAEKIALRTKWMRFISPPWSQPLETEPGDPTPGVRDYFGEAVAIYFAWLGHYTTWLIVPAILGIVVGAIQSARGDDDDSPVIAGFAVFMAMWAVLFLEAWKRKENVLAMEWGMTEFEETEQPRPQFEGRVIRSPVNGEEIIYYPHWKKVLKMMASQSVVTSAIIAVIAGVVGIFFFRVWATQVENIKVGGHEIGGPLSGFLNAITIMIFNRIYGMIAAKLTAWENHRTDTEFEDALITKSFLFQFVNSYSSLFWIAFIKGHFNMLGESTKCGSDGNCMNTLGTQLGIIFVSQIFVNNFMEIIIPLIKSSIKSRKEAKGVPMVTDEEGNQVPRFASQAEREYAMPDYPGTFGDFNEMAVQFGYVTLFVVAFPYAPLAALINNYVEIRVDASKLTTETRRAEPRGAEDIGTWYIILDVLSKIAIITNLAIVMWTSSVFDSESNATKFAIFLVAEHVILGIRYIIALIPDMPQDVKIQLERQTFLVDKLILEVPDEDEGEEADIAGATRTTEEIRIWESDA